MKKTLFSAMALGALIATNLKAQTWATGTGLLYANPTTTKIGIGTNAPGEALEVKDGNIKLNYTSPASSFAVGKNPSNSKLGVFATGTDLTFSTNNATTASRMTLKADGRLMLGSTTFGNNDLSTQLLMLRNPNPNTCTLIRMENGSNTGGLEINASNGNGSAFAADGDAIITDFGPGKKINFMQFTTPTSTPKAAFVFSTINNSTAAQNIVMQINDNGGVLIGDQNALNAVKHPTDPSQNPRLFVQGGILTEKLKVSPKSTADWSWPDYVFSKSYILNSLDSVETFINKNSHLPDVPSAKEIGTNGFDVAEMDSKLLRKVEELTLYMIEMNKKINSLERENNGLKNEIETLKK